jgi:DNA-binding CsgD family transcriptional regulator
VRFAHPLFAASILAASTPAARRDAHARLAVVADGADARARHRALAATDPSEAVAADLELAAREASARGGPAAAAELLELALGATPPSDGAARDRRGIELAGVLQRAGDPAHAERRLLDVIDAASSPAARARARLALASIRYERDAAGSALALCEVAMTDAAGEPELLARAHAIIAAVSWDDFRRRESHVREAMRLLDGVADPDPVVLGLVLMERCEDDVSTGRPLDPAIVDRALALEQDSAAPSVADRFSASLGTWLKYLDDFEGARTWLERTLQAVEDEGDDGSLAYALSHLPELELWTGRWDAAEVIARRHHRAATDLELESQRRQALYNLALVHTHQGRTEEARAAVREALGAAEADGDTWTQASVLPVLGQLELSLGDAAAAAVHLRLAAELRDGLGQRAPRRQDADLVEGLVATGDLDGARTALASMEDRAVRFGRHSALAAASRARALVQAASGDLDGAVAALEVAMAEHALAPIAFDRARTLLVAGQVRRRRRERGAAGVALREAAETFERLGARAWAERTRAELGRVGLRRSSGVDLTETERRVAELAASGRTNREVAAALFLSPKTVEANLARAYGKLGIASRAELGALLGRLADAGAIEPGGQR